MVDVDEELERMEKEEFEKRWVSIFGRLEAQISNLPLLDICDSKHTPSPSAELDQHFVTFNETCSIGLVQGPPKLFGTLKK